jgi:hypothetical protein
LISTGQDGERGLPGRFSWKNITREHSRTLDGAATWSRGPIAFVTPLAPVADLEQVQAAVPQRLDDPAMEICP